MALLRRPQLPYALCQGDVVTDEGEDKAIRHQVFDLLAISSFNLGRCSDHFGPMMYIFNVHKELKCLFPLPNPGSSCPP